MKTSALVIAALFATAQAIRLDQRFADGFSDQEIMTSSLTQAENKLDGICDGPNGSNMQDCRTTRHGDQNPVCRGRDGEESERNCVNRTAYGISNSLAQHPSDLPADHNPICSGIAGQEKERNCLDRKAYEKTGPVSLAEGICDGPNGSNMQDCRTTRHGDQNPVCRGRDGEESERNCVNRSSYGIAASLVQLEEPSGGNPTQICNGTNTGHCIEADDFINSKRNSAVPEDTGLTVLQMTNGSQYVVTCSDRQQEDCQPVCTESLSRGCTEARTPNWPSQDRFEGKYTHK
jgi:hypothetical protein